MNEKKKKEKQRSSLFLYKGERSSSSITSSLQRLRTEIDGNKCRKKNWIEEIEIVKIVNTSLLYIVAIFFEEIIITIIILLRSDQKN